MLTPVTVDGTVDPREWNSAQAASPVEILPGPASESTSIRLAYDEESLYIAIHCADSDITARGPDFSKNDSVRINIQLGVVETDEFHRFAFGITPWGLLSARVHKGRTPLMREYRDVTKPLSPEMYQAASIRGDWGWSTELALSWNAIHPLSSPPTPFGMSMERRNINGDKIFVAGWPYDRDIVFQFEADEDDEGAPTKPSTATE